MEKGHTKFRFNNEEAIFNICIPMKQSGELKTVSAISYKVESTSEVQIEGLCIEVLAAVIMIMRVMVLKSMGLWSRHLSEAKISPYQTNWSYI